MRPTTHPQSGFRAPLNHVLGTEANVRILRVLALAGTPLGQGELARRASLQPAGVRRVVASLARLGIIEAVGAGPRQQVRWRDEYPLAPLLRGLFKAETERVERLLNRLRHAAEALTPRPDAMWIEGSFAAGQDRPGDPLLIGVLARSGEAERIGELLRKDPAELERAEDVTIEFRVRSRADLIALPRAEQDALARAIPVYGLPPGSVFGEPAASTSRQTRTHAEQDTRALALARAVATKLAKDPGLIQLARDRIARRLSEASPQEQAELREWDHVLRTMSQARLHAFLTDPGERATRLRQTLPFLGMLSQAERDAVLRKTTG